MSHPQQFVCTVDPKSKDGALTCKPVAKAATPKAAQASAPVKAAGCSPCEAAAKLRAEKAKAAVAPAQAKAAVRPAQVKAAAKPAALKTAVPVQPVLIKPYADPDCLHKIVFTQALIDQTKNNGAPAVTDPATGVTITLKSADGTLFDFTANSPAVVGAYVADFNKASQNYYDYSLSPVDADTDIHAPSGDDVECPSAADEIIFCVDIKHLISISKTAVATYKKKCQRTLEVTAKPKSVCLEVDVPGAECPLTAQGRFVVSWDGSIIDYDFKVSGSITVKNDSLVAVTIQSVSDILSTGPTNAVVSGSLPAVLAAGATTSFAYTASVPNPPAAAGAAGVNTASASIAIAGEVVPYEAKAGYAWDQVPEPDDCDTKISVTVAGAKKDDIELDGCGKGSQEYCVTIGPYYQTGSTTVGASASIAASSCQAALSAQASIAVTVTA